MRNTNSFFFPKNTVRQLTEGDLRQTANYLEAIAAFARTTYNSVYVIDYKSKGFEYVSDNPLFLCGKTSDEVKAMGYDFYFEHVPKEDLELLLKINTAGFDFYEKLPLAERKQYTITYDFHLRTEEGKQILINQKLSPIFLTDAGKIWKAICIVSLSTHQKSGNIKIYSSDTDKSFSYDVAGNYWKKNGKIELSEREREIIHYSIRGYAIGEIAEKIFLSPDTVKFHRRKLFEKLGVANISEAISYVTVNKLI